MTFDSRDAGTPASDWDLGDVPTLPLPGPRDRVLVVAAHPDDETLGAGGLIAACARLGVGVTVVVATDGEASHPGSPTHSPARLAEIRRGEVTAAVQTLAPNAALHFLGLPDGRLAEHRDALGAQLSHFARGATLIVTPWVADRHPDHEACGQAGDRIAGAGRLRHWQYPIWAWHWGNPSGDDVPSADLGRIGLVGPDRDTKQRALACHASQHRALSPAPQDAPVLSAAMLEHFTRADEFFVAHREADASRPEYFDALYARADDPWGLHERFYEQRKRELVLAALPRARFRRAFEPGCATGLLTEELGRRCDEVVAWDVAGAAVRQARGRTNTMAEQVSVEVGQIPADWPEGRFDLIVLCEVGYYCRDLDVLVARVHGSLADDGAVLTCHWRHHAPDHPHDAIAVHGALGQGLRPIVEHVEADFLLDVWTRSGRSVATDEGILA